jgi:hypothetical protein
MHVHDAAVVLPLAVFGMFERLDINSPSLVWARHGHNSMHMRMNVPDTRQYCCQPVGHRSWDVGNNMLAVCGSAVVFAALPQRL